MFLERQLIASKTRGADKKYDKHLSARLNFLMKSFSDLISNVVDLFLYLIILKKLTTELTFAYVGRGSVTTTVVGIWYFVVSLNFSLESREILCASSNFDSAPLSTKLEKETLPGMQIAIFFNH